MIQLILKYRFRTEPDQLLGHQYNPDFRVCKRFPQRLLHFFLLMDYDPFDPGQAHSHLGIDIIANHKKFHGYRVLSSRIALPNVPSCKGYRREPAGVNYSLFRIRMEISKP